MTDVNCSRRRNRLRIQSERSLYLIVRVILLLNISEKIHVSTCTINIMDVLHRRTLNINVRLFSDIKKYLLCKRDMLNGS